MANQLLRGLTLVDGTSYASADFHTFLENSKLLPPAITDQTAAAPAVADSFFYYQSSSAGLRKCTLQDIIDGFPVDAVATSKALRTLGSGATQAVAGNDTRFPATVTGIRLSAGGGGTDTAAAPKDFAFTPTNLSGGTNINWDNSDFFYDTLTGSTDKTYTFSNVRDGRSIVLALATASFSGNILFPALFGTAPVKVAGATVHYFTFFKTPLSTNASGIVKAL